MLGVCIIVYHNSLSPVVCQQIVSSFQVSVGTSLCFFCCHERVCMVSIVYQCTGILASVTTAEVKQPPMQMTNLVCFETNLVYIETTLVFSEYKLLQHVAILDMFCGGVADVTDVTYVHKTCDVTDGSA